MRGLLKTAAAIAATTMVLLAPATASADSAQTRPLTGQTVGQDTTDPAAPGCIIPPGTPAGSYLRYSSKGPGFLSHVGRVASTVTHCTFMTSPTTGTFGPGSAVFTAPDGDTITMSYTGTFKLTMGTSGPVRSDATMTWTITGGTGTFDHATGSGTGVGYTDFKAGTTTMNYKGTITYNPAAHG